MKVADAVRRLVGIHVHEWEERYFETKNPYATHKMYGRECACGVKQVYISCGNDFDPNYQWVNLGDFEARYKPEGMIGSIEEFVERATR